MQSRTFRLKALVCLFSATISTFSFAALKVEPDEHSASEPTIAPQAQRPRPSATDEPRAPGVVPRSFRIGNFAPPPPYQRGTGMCLFFASTQVMEWLYNRSKCQKPTVRGNGDFSERYFYGMNQANSSLWRGNYWTDSPLAYQRTGYVLDRDLPFDGRVAPVNPRRYHVHRDLPEFTRKVLVYTDERSPHEPSPGISRAQIESIKRALATYKSPVLFMYQPTGTNRYGRRYATTSWWHSNTIVGYDETGFIMRDSAFGNKLGGGRVGVTHMSYAAAMRDGKFASVYHLRHEPRCAGDAGRGNGHGTEQTTIEVSKTVSGSEPTGSPAATPAGGGAGDWGDEAKPTETDYAKHPGNGVKTRSSNPAVEH